MLLHKERLAGSLVNASLQAMRRVVPISEGGTELYKSRFVDVVDTGGHECGAVTKHYHLVTNGDLISAVDLASDGLGVDVEAGKGRYANGRARYTLYLPDDYRVPGDPSGLRPQIELGNSYGGKAALTGKAGVFRLACKNGMVVGKVVRADYQRHIGEFDLMKFVTTLMTAVIDRAEAYKVMAQIAAETEFSTIVDGVMDEAVKADRERNRDFIVSLADKTPKKYIRPLRRAILSNRRELGSTVWAISQAIAEVSTHDMEGWAAGDWQQRETNRLLETVGISV